MSAPPRITIIGAGGITFPLRLIGDMLSFPALRGADYQLMDVALDRAERTAGNARELAAHYGFDATFTATDDLRAALAGTDAVIITFQVGGWSYIQADHRIPRQYGVDQAVGDTIGPGGVFRFLRSVNAYREIADAILDLVPTVQVINYANPMCMACWYLKDRGIRVVGLCHSVQGTSRMLARALDADYDRVTYKVAGINHQAWFTEFRVDGEDAYPRLRAVMTERHLGRKPGGVAGAEVDHSLGERTDSLYEGASEKVRTAIMDTFGYFHTESSHHASEYLPYFRKTPDQIADFIPERWGIDPDREPRIAEDVDRQRLDELKAELKPSVEYGAVIVNAMITDTPAVIYGNVANDGLIDNLPADCIVELACLVDGNGVQPVAYGSLPPQCASVNHTNINVQRMAVVAAQTCSLQAAEQAIALDPLTAAICTLDQIRAMTRELYAASKPLLEGVIAELEQ